VALLRLRIAVVDGMRNMYYDYAHKKAEVVAELRQELFGEVVDIVSDETEVEILFMDWDRHKMVAEVSQLMSHECNA
jgi:hypothetical protein